MQKLVWQNSNGETIDLTSGSYGITEWEGFSNASLNIQSQQVPFQDGAVFLDALIEPRELSVTLAMQDNNDLELRYQLRRELIHKLNPKLGEGYLIYTNDFISKRIKCVAQIPLFETHNSNDSGTPKASLSWVANEPYWEDLEETEVTFGITSQPIIKNEGDIPCQLEIELYTNSVNDGAIINKTTNKKIEYKGQLTEDILINTNIGKKSVVVANQFNYLFANNSNTIVTLCYSNGLYLLGGFLGFYAISKNGNVWKQISNTERETIIKIKYINNWFYRLGTYTIARSRDGVIWEDEFDSFEIQNYIDVTYAENLNLYFIIKGNQIVKTSGVIPSGAVKTGSYGSIAYSKDLELLIAVGNSGEIITSSNGTDWTTQTSGVSVNLSKVDWIEDLALFVVVGASGTILTSPNGVTWTQRTSGVSVNIIDFVYAGLLNEVICLCSNGSFLESTNLNDWINTQSPANSLNSIVYDNDNGVILASGQNGVIIKGYSTSEMEIIKQGLSRTPIKIFFDERTQCFVGISSISSSNSVVLKSKSLDSNSWEEYSVGVGNPQKCIYCASLDLYILCANNGKIATSSDLQNWTQRTSGVNVNLNYLVCFEKLKLLVAVGNSGVIITSEDGITWTSQTSGVNNNLTKVIDAGDNILVCSNSTFILKSADGETWESITVGSEDITSITYSKALKKCVVTAGTRYSYSTYDFINWVRNNILTSYSASLNAIIFDIDYSEKMQMFVAIGYNKALSISSDGDNWNDKTGVTDPYQGYIAHSDEKEMFFSSSTYAIYYSEINIGENRIDKITNDSDIGLNLAIGDNQFRLSKTSGNLTARIKYRQKYIGV